jgi:cyclophilin family peptidyl-prolyl cis-trans isomerase
MLKLNVRGVVLSVFAIAGLAFASSVEADSPRVALETSEGRIVIELNAEKAPKTVENFLNYVKEGHYEGTLFHRVIPEFMVQGGGFDVSMKEKSTFPPVRNEASNGLTNDEYTLAMARTSDPHSATSQFFINTSGENSFLSRDHPRSDGFGYTVFGKVVEGQSVVDQIEAKPTRSIPNPAAPGQLMGDVPVEPITIKSATILAPAN